MCGESRGGAAGGSADASAHIEPWCASLRWTGGTIHSGLWSSSWQPACCTLLPRQDDDLAAPNTTQLIAQPRFPPGPLCSAPKMRVLNNGAGTLTYNRCSSCDASELKCKVGPRGKQLNPCCRTCRRHAGRTGLPTARPVTPTLLGPTRRTLTLALLAQMARWTDAPHARQAGSWIPRPLCQSSTLTPVLRPPRTTAAANRALTHLVASLARRATQVSGALITRVAGGPCRCPAMHLQGICRAADGCSRCLLSPI